MVLFLQVVTAVLVCLLQVQQCAVYAPKVLLEAAGQNQLFSLLCFATQAVHIAFAGEYFVEWVAFA